MAQARIDISEIWDNAGVLAAFLLSAGLVVLSIRLRRRWIRVSAVVLASFVFVVVSGVTFFVGCDVARSNTRIPPIPSPDRRHVAVIRWWLPGALGHDMVHISIRKPYSLFASEVLYGTGEPPEAAGGEPNPKVEWIDSRTLAIIYSEKASLKPCSPTAKPVDGIRVLCRD